MTHITLLSSFLTLSGQIGLRGVFQGTMATLYRDAPASAGYFGAYEYVKRLLRGPDGKTSNSGLLLAGGMAGVANWTVSPATLMLASLSQSIFCLGLHAIGCCQVPHPNSGSWVS